MSHCQELGPSFGSFSCTHISIAKQVITALLEKTIQGQVVRKIPSKALTAEPLLEAHRRLAGRWNCHVSEFLSTSVPGIPVAQPLEQAALGQNQPEWCDHTF